MDIEKSKSEVEELFESLNPIVNEVVKKNSTALDNIIKRLINAEALTNDELREGIMSLSIEAYMFALRKDQSIFKQECATTLMKEGIAKAYNGTEGTQVVRNNQAMIDTTDRQVVNMLYSAVANMMKTKLDEAHRLVNALNSILISRNAEAKMAFNRQSSDEFIIEENE